MTARERDSFEVISEKIDSFIEKQYVRDEKIDSIHRALYGDAINKTSGLIDKQNIDDLERMEARERNTKIDTILEGMIENVDKNTNFRKKATKIMYISGGSIGVGGASAATFWDTVKTFVTKML